MSKSPLIIGATQRAGLHKLRQVAAENPIPMQQRAKQIETAAGRAAHIKQMSALSLALPMTYFVTFTIEDHHPLKAGMVRHLSMSSSRRGKTPTPEAVWMVAEELGFVGSLQQCHVWIEDCASDQGNGTGNDKAVNVVQQIGISVVSERAQ